jgi:hypothetical protein
MDNNNIPAEQVYGSPTTRFPSDNSSNCIKSEKSYSFNAPATKNALEEVKFVREQALENAKKALEEAFLDKKNTIRQKISTPTDAKLVEAIQDARKVTEATRIAMEKEEVDNTKKRKEAVEDAKNTLYTAFNKKFEDMFQEKLEDDKNVRNTNLANECTHGNCENHREEVSGEDIDGIIKELEEEITGGNKPSVSTDGIFDYQYVSEKKKTVAETKNLIKNFKEKTANYPMHISYDGSMVLCVLLSLNQNRGINLNGLPEEDRELVLKLLPKNAEEQLGKCNSQLNVEFDKDKDFVLSYIITDSRKESDVIINIFNEVIHPTMKSITSTVPVEKDGENISVGDGKIVLNKKFIQKMIGVTPPIKESQVEEEMPYRRQPVAGRNAYEIRADVLQMAIDWSMGERVSLRYGNPDDVIGLAKKFYSFVENRR